VLKYRRELKVLTPTLQLGETHQQESFSLGPPSNPQERDAAFHLHWLFNASIQRIDVLRLAQRKKSNYIKIL